MSAIRGWLWLGCCIALAIGVFVFDVIYADNALPQAIDQISKSFTQTVIATQNSNVQLFIVIIRWTPLFIVAAGMIGWYVETVTWGSAQYET